VACRFAAFESNIWNTRSSSRQFTDVIGVAFNAPVMNMSNVAWRSVVMNERRTELKAKAISEAKKFAVIVGYLWVLFVLFELHKVTILREEDTLTPFGYRAGFALINALILGKIILIAEAFHFGERFQDKPLAYAVLFKSAAFSVLLVCCDMLEEMLVGVFHHNTIAESIPRLGGGGAEGILLVGLMVFIVLMPFFLFTEVARVIGENELMSIIFKRGKSQRLNRSSNRSS
jgi:hypothetical protein